MFLDESAYDDRLLPDLQTLKEIFAYDEDAEWIRRGNQLMDY